MQFLIIAYDYEDEGALERRMKAREAHVAHIATARMKGHALMGAAILDDDGKMVGSSITVDFPTREAMESWLDTDPYLTGEVWEHVYIQPCSVAPAFINK